VKNIALKVAIAICSMFIFAPSFAQKNYLPAYLISLKGDTVRGFIHYANWGNNPKKINFKDNLTSESRSINVLEIKGFSVADERYESAIVQVEKSSNNTMNLERSGVFIFQKDTVFLQSIIDGNKSLYYYNKKSGKEQFYIKTDTAFTLLLYKVYLDPNNKNKITHKGIVSVENKKYLSQLVVYLNDCKNIQSLLSQSNYNKKSMESVFLKYYECAGKSIEFQKKTEKIKLEFYGLIGFAASKIKFDDNENYIPYLSANKYKTSYSISGGIAANFIIPRNRERWSLASELFFTSYRISGTYKVYDNPMQYITYRSEIGRSLIKSNNLVKFKYPIGQLFVFANAGASFGLNIHETNKLREESVFFSTTTVSETKAINLRTLERSVLAGVGISYKKISFETSRTYAN
jgi:hypothetical protein